MDKNQRVRYIVFQDGEFIETVHNKESYYVSTQDKESEKSSGSQGGQKSAESNHLSEDIQNKNGLKSIFNLVFTLSLVIGFCLLFSSYNHKLETSLPYLNTSSSPVITDASTGDTQSPGISSKEINNLTYVLHTHHSINGLYEEAKQIVSSYANGSISKMAFETSLTNLANQIKTLISYNESQVSDNEALNQLYATTSIRLEFLLEVLREVVTANSRVLIIDVLNKGIESDKPLFNSQITNFKAILDGYGIAYTEKDNRLTFEFPR